MHLEMHLKILYFSFVSVLLSTSHLCPVLSALCCYRNHHHRTEGDDNAAHLQEQQLLIEKAVL